MWCLWIGGTLLRDIHHMIATVFPIPFQYGLQWAFAEHVWGMRMLGPRLTCMSLIFAWFFLVGA